MPVDPFASAIEMVRMLRAGEVSSRDLVELHLERIARLDDRAMRVLAGVAPRDEEPQPEHLRVALWLGGAEFAPSREVEALIGAAAEALASAGASVKEAAPDFDAAEARDVAFQLWVAAVVLCPVSPVPAVRHDPEPAEVDSVDRRLERTIDVDGRRRPYLDQIMWNIVVGMARLPSTVAPVGRTAAGLPVGAQVVGSRHADALTIAVAGILGDLAGGYAVPPGFGP